MVETASSRQRRLTHKPCAASSGRRGQGGRWVNFFIRRDETLGLVGENGCGKTDEPALREVRPGHFAACHYAEDLTLRGVVSDSVVA